MSPHSLHQRPVNNYGKRLRLQTGYIGNFPFLFYKTSNSVISSPDEIANILGETFHSVPSTASYNSRFLEIKRQAERTPINFSTRSFFHIIVTSRKENLFLLYRVDSARADPLGNLVFLESQIRDAFVRRNHLVSLFFDIEKAYDRTWRYGILRNMYDFGLRGNLPIFIFNCLAVRYFHVRIGHLSSHKFMQDQGVPQGSVLSVTLFNIHMSSILNHLPPSVRGMLYVDDLEVSCQCSDMRLIERQLQTTVNRLVKWCDQNGHKISPSKSSCVHFCRKRNLHPDPFIHIGNIQTPVVSEYYQTPYGERTVSLLRVYQALILSRLDYGCVVYGSASATVLKRLDTIHHSAPRIFSGAFRTAPVTSLYVVCHQPPSKLRRRQLSANYFIRAMSVPFSSIKTVFSCHWSQPTL
ncbi:putative RNA-directed DNA polymerase from transposon X-element [Trichonephila clavipes]|nr:putative RNA-directed DNA polymerase from transposon X-element [Trichonephila clavipes]